MVRAFIGVDGDLSPLFFTRTPLAAVVYFPSPQEGFSFPKGKGERGKSNWGGKKKTIFPLIHPFF